VTANAIVKLITVFVIELNRTALSLTFVLSGSLFSLVIIEVSRAIELWVLAFAYDDTDIAMEKHDTIMIQVDGVAVVFWKNKRVAVENVVTSHGSNGSDAADG